MDSIRQSIIQKRDRLGWSNKKLAEKCKVPSIVIQRFLEGSVCLSGYISQINSYLNQAINSQWVIEMQQNADKNKITNPINENTLINRKPSKKRGGWALRYSQCTKCGSSDKPHIARGLCRNCYDKDIEKRHKDSERIQNYGGSSKLLTEEYLLEHYVKQQKSLSDIAKETNCSRQYVHKKLKEHSILLRNKSAARDLALANDKLKFERFN